jgi:hypothetical protein
MAFDSDKIDRLLEDISNKLDSILRVLSLQVTADLSMTDAAELLKKTGMDNRTIAAVLNTNPEVIRVLIARRKR